MPTVTQTISQASADALSTITMDQSKDQTDTSLTVPFNQTVTSQTITNLASANARATITIAKSQDETDTSLTSDFNQTTSVTVTQVLSATAVDEITIPDVRPITFGQRTANPALKMYERSDATKPIVMHSRSPFVLINKTDTSLASDGNLARANKNVEVTAVDAQATVSIDKTQDKTDTSLTSDFSS